MVDRIDDLPRLVRSEARSHPKLDALIDCDAATPGPLPHLGERVMQVLEASLKDQGITLSLLETGADQHAAVRLYERAGYVKRGPFGGYPDNGLSVFYEKRL